MVGDRLVEGRWSEDLIKKIMFGLLISPVQFGGVLFCYSNCNFFYIDDKEEAIFINYR